jgi:hypothetical protein
MSWLFAGLFALAWGAYGLWQRERAKRQQGIADALRAGLHDMVRKIGEERLKFLDERNRLEAVIADLKVRLKKAEEDSIANLSPDAIRVRLAELLSSRP